MLKLMYPIVLCGVVVLIISCKQEKLVSEETKQLYSLIEPGLNDFIKEKQGIIGFGGQVFCSLELIGRDGNDFYLWSYCQEYHTSEDSLQLGNGSVIPTKVTVENHSIVDYVVPKDGSAYTSDIQKIFPKKIAQKILDASLKAQVFNHLYYELEAISIASFNFECSIKSLQSTYVIGETPKLEVLIKNNSPHDVYLLGALDGSEVKWRMPYCYFKIEKPMKDTLPIVGRCGNINTLRIQDFTKVSVGASFNPYTSNDRYFESYEVYKKDNFRKAGKYRITFYYSTKGEKIESYIGKLEIPSKEKKELMKLFNEMPHIELKSNAIEIEMISS